jgi:peptide/nickel transport system substrate-binding protein
VGCSPTYPDFAMKIFLTLSTLSIILIFCYCDNSTNTLLTYGIQYSPTGLDPAKDFGVDAINIYSQIYETLVILDPDDKQITPHLAKDWSVSNDYKSYEFHLRENVKFHDGSKLNAETVTRSYLRQITMNQKSPLFSQIESINPKDSLTLEILLKSPNPIFLFNLTSPISLLAISNNLLNTSDSIIANHPVGTGPYKFENWDNNKSIRLSQFTDYWGNKGQPAEVNFKFFENNSDREESILKNKVDILYSISGFALDRLKWLGKIEYKVISPYSTIFIGFNLNDTILKNKEIREAILKCINLPELVLNILRGNSLIAKGPLPPSLFHYNNISQENYNPEEANQLLKDLGIKGKLKLKLFYPKEAFVRQTIFEFIKANLAKVGITLEIIPFDTWEEHNLACQSDSAQLFIGAWGSDVLGDPENFLYSLFYSTSEFNYFHYHNVKVDRWLEEAAQEPMREKRDILYQKIVKTILDDTPAVFLYHVKPHFAYNKEKIKYLPVNPYGIIQFNQIILNDN